MFGFIGKDLVSQFQSGLDRNKLKLLYEAQSEDCVFYEDEGHASKAGMSVFVSKDKLHALMVRGEVYNLETLGCRKNSCLAEALWDLYQSRGDSFYEALNGAFVLVVWNGATKTLRIVRDKIGILQCFYAEKSSGIVFGNDPAQVQRLLSSPPRLDQSALIQYLLYCYNPGATTLYKSVDRLRPGHYLKWENGQITDNKYWDIRFEPDESLSEPEWSEAIRDTLEKAVRIRKEKEKTGAFLSGGLDSSSVVSLLNKQGVDDLSTFSFRCKGESFDESHYAKIVADAFSTRHQVIEYAAEDILKTETMVTLMDEPFSDVGINIATYLLAQAAGGQVRFLFTGDGGDELFAGHPVYMADKMGALFRFIPSFIRRPLFSFGRSLPDSEQKKDWKVKLKRFSESYAFPEKLGTQRWRIYYGQEDIASLINPDIMEPLAENEIFVPMIQHNEEANGKDTLGRSLHADYQTVVQFYLRRMEMPRAFGLSPRFPMLDPELVELCASMPSKYKIRGWGDTKYIEKKAVEPLLPHEIVYRKDKLGHSIPLKNWIRDHQQAKSFVHELISESTLKKRGLFNPSFVQKMWDEHQAKTRNHSHRLWALAVLELWMRGKGI